jgi:hypothetical protein
MAANPKGVDAQWAGILCLSTVQFLPRQPLLQAGNAPKAAIGKTGIPFALAKSS